MVRWHAQALEVRQPDYIEELMRDLLELETSLHAVAIVPARSVPAADHVVILHVARPPFSSSSWGFFERDGQVVGMHVSPSLPASLYPPRSLLAAPPADLATIDANRRSGDALIDAMLDGLAAGDGAAVEALVDYQQLGCVLTAGDIGHPPICAEDEPEGTLVDVLPVGQCEGVYSRASSVLKRFEGIAEGKWVLFAASDLGVEPGQSTAARARRQAVLLAAAEDEDAVWPSLAMAFSDVGITNLQYPCASGDPHSIMWPGLAPAFLLPPPAHPLAPRPGWSALDRRGTIVGRRRPSMVRNPTRPVRIGPITIGSGAPIAVQSMAATKTQDVEATVAQVELLERAGADLVRIAVDSRKDVEALAELRARTSATLSVDLQENYRLAAIVAPHVDKIRYNPGHLWHHEREKPVRDKVALIAETAEAHDCAIRIGVNCGSVDPEQTAAFGDDDVGAMVASALEHCALLDGLGFERYVVSLKDSDWKKVVEGNRRFAAERPDVPLHLGVTEAGMLPEGEIKTRLAFEQLVPEGIGDTVRVSLTLPFEDKGTEIEAGRRILADIESGRFRSVPTVLEGGLNIISCPSCSRVENEAFIELAQDVREVTAWAKQHEITIAVMGCRVNGPGETDDADLGLWCGPVAVNLKRGEQLVGAFAYDEVLDRLRHELESLVAERAEAGAGGR